MHSPAFVAIDAVYRPRNPVENPLYPVVAGRLETFLARQRERDRNVPGFEVTRRRHPLFGRELEIIHANKVMLTIRLANGSTMKMPRAWTNAGGATGVVEPLRCSVFTVEGVREFIDLVSALRRRD